MNMKPGPISSEDLMRNLVNAKKVMTKVDSGNYQTGQINPDTLYTEDEDVSDMEDMIMEAPRHQKQLPRQQRPQPMEQPTRQPEQMSNPIGAVNESRIMQSKLPDAIKRAMIDNPIPQITMDETLSMDVLKGAKRLMEQEGLLTSPQQTQQRPSQRSVQQPMQFTQSQTPLSIQPNLDITALIPIMENVIRKVLDEKLTQIFSAQAQQTTAINENLMLKVGNNIFSGKITNVKKAK